MDFLSSPSFFSLVPLALFILFLFKWFYTYSTAQRKQPPSPPKLPIIGNLHQLGLFPHLSLQSLSKQYGPLMLLHLGSKPVIVVTSADAAREIMKNQDTAFANRPKKNIPYKVFYGAKEAAFAPYGEYWRQVKRIFVLTLTSNTRVQSYRHVREDETSKMIEKIRQSCSSSSSSIVDLKHVLCALANDVLCRVVLGKNSGDNDGKKIEPILRELMELLGVFDIGDYLPWLAWVNRVNGLDAKLEKVTKELDEILENVVEEHKKESKGDCFLDTLLELQRENSTGTFPVERDTIKALLLSAFGGGIHTISTLMGWTMAEILKHPKVLQKLQTEVRQVAQGKSELNEDDLEKMAYLKAVTKETLRLHCPVTLLVPRETIQPTKLMGYEVSVGTQVIINAWAIARDPMLWKNPEEFLPERFLDSNMDFRGTDYEFVPFGAGRRACPGISMSIALNDFAIASLLHKFDFVLPDGAKPEDLDMTEENGISVARKHPLLAVAKPYSA